MTFLDDLERLEKVRDDPLCIQEYRNHGTRVSKLVDVDSSALLAIAHAHNRTFTVRWKPEESHVSVFFQPPPIDPPERVSIVTERKEDFIKSVEDKLGWKHTGSVDSGHITILSFTPRRDVDRYVCETLQRADTISYIRFHATRWEVAWNEEGDIMDSLRARKRTSSHLFTPKIPHSAGKSHRRPSNNHVQKVLRYLGFVAPLNERHAHKEEREKAVVPVPSAVDHHTDEKSLLH